MVIAAGDESWHALRTVAGRLNRIEFDFSKHSFDGNRGEPRGWRQQYVIDYCNGLRQKVSIEVGDDTKGTNVNIPISSQVFLPPGDQVRVMVLDSAYEDNRGAVVIRVRQD